jgi:L-fucose isomerase
LLNTSFDWNGIREAYVIATENDACNGVAMLFGHLLTNRAQIFSDVRTYWSPDAVKRVTGKELTGLAANGIIHLINSGATTLDGTGRQSNAQGEPAMKLHWEISEAEMEQCLEATPGIRQTAITSVAAVSPPTSCQRVECLSPCLA